MQSGGEALARLRECVTKGRPVELKADCVLIDGARFDLGLLTPYRSLKGKGALYKLDALVYFVECFLKQEPPMKYSVYIQSCNRRQKKVRYLPRQDHKTINRYMYEEFGKTTMTIGAYFAMKQCKLKNGRSKNLAIWDTAGEEKFDSLTNFYCRDACAALVCYDVTDKSSFDNIQKWVNKVKMEADPNCAMLLVGNKIDLLKNSPESRQVELSKVQKYADSLGVKVYEVSAKSGVNIDKIFTQVVELAVQMAPSKSYGVGLPAESKGGCCS